MEKDDRYTIPLKSLSVGVHTYEYVLDTSFFSGIEDSEIKKGNLTVQVTVNRISDTFELHFTIKGVITIPCDRCLDDMEWPVDTKETLFVKLGKEEGEEDDNIIIVPEAEGCIDLTWYLYECVALAIPLVHMHPKGQCNPEMEKLLQAHSAANITEEEEVDPRWNALKKIKEN